MNVHTKALRAHRKRLKSRGLKRVEVTVRAEDVALMRDVAAKLRESRAIAKRVKAALAESRGPTIAEVINAGPDISGPEFDAVFEEIERFRHDPVMMRVRDVDL